MMNYNKSSSEQVTASVKSCLKMVGINVETKSVGMKAKILVISAMYFLASCILSMVVEWSNVRKRFLSFEDINITVTSAVFLIEFTCKLNDVSSTLSIIDQNYYSTLSTNNSYTLPNSIKRHIKHFQEREIRIGNVILIIVRLAIGNIVLTPTLEQVYALLVKRENIFKSDVGDLSLPTEYYYFFSKSMFMYFIIFFLQSLYFFNVHLVTFAIFAINILSLYKVTSQIKLCYILLKELAEIKCKNREKKISKFNGKRLFKIEYLKTHNEDDGNDLLKIQFQNLIKHHQVIIRNLMLLNKNLSSSTAVLNHAICIVICISLYSFTETSNIYIKIKYLTFCIPVVYMLFIYNSFGQDLFNEGEKLRFALYDCPWLETPLWFQKHLYFMMLCAKDCSIKPYGLYAVNLNNFAKILNAAYSYFNLLQSVKNKHN